MSALRDISTIPNTTTRTSDYLLPPLSDADNLWHSKMNFPVRSSDISTPHERLEECDRFEKIYKGYDAYHSQVRKLDWLKSHHAYTASPEVSKHAEWLIETLYAIVARWEEVLPYIAEPYPIPLNSPSTFPFNAIPEPPSGRESLGVLLEGLEGRGRAMMGQPFINNADVLAEIDLPGFGTRRVLKVFKLFEVQQLALHTCFIRNLVLSMDKLETACRQHGVISTSVGSGCVADMLVDVERDVLLVLTPPAMESSDGPFDVEKPTLSLSVLEHGCLTQIRSRSTAVRRGGNIMRIALDNRSYLPFDNSTVISFQRCSSS